VTDNQGKTKISFNKRNSWNYAGSLCTDIVSSMLSKVRIYNYVE